MSSIKIYIAHVDNKIRYLKSLLINACIKNCNKKKTNSLFVRIY